MTSTPEVERDPRIRCLGYLTQVSEVRFGGRAICPLTFTDDTLHEVIYQRGSPSAKYLPLICQPAILRWNDDIKSRIERRSRDPVDYLVDLVRLNWPSCRDDLADHAIDRMLAEERVRHRATVRQDEGRVARPRRCATSALSGSTASAT